MNDERLIAPLNCNGCGAPLPASLKCIYCNTIHERVRRYNGPEVQELNRPYNPTFDMMNGSSSCASAVSYISTSATFVLMVPDNYG